MLMIFFGSYASGRYAAASDIDILIVHHVPRRENAYSVCWGILSLTNAEIYIYSEEYAGLKRSGSSFTREAEEKGQSYRVARP